MAGIFNSAIFNNAIFNTGEAAPVVIETTTPPSGVSRGKKKIIVRMSDVENRVDTAEFLKAQLRLRHPSSVAADTSAEDEKKRLAAQARREKAMRDKAAKAAAAFEKQRAEMERQNAEELALQEANMRTLLMIASMV